MDGFFEGRVMGVVAHEPKLYNSDDGKSTLYLSLLVTKTFGDKTWKQYVDVAVKGRYVDAYSDRITKGMTIMLSGDIQSKKKKGTDVYVQYLSVFLDTLRVLDGINETQGAYTPSRPGGYDDDPSIPF